MFHLVYAKLDLGCNLLAFDTEQSESSHIPFVKDAYNHSSKRLGTRLPEMLSFILDQKLVAHLRHLLVSLDAATATATAAATLAAAATVPATAATPRLDTAVAPDLVTYAAAGSFK